MAGCATGKKYLARLGTSYKLVSMVVHPGKISHGEFTDPLVDLVTIAVMVVVLLSVSLTTQRRKWVRR